MKTKSSCRDRRGATMVMIALLLPAMLALAAFAINIAHMESVRTECQITTDAAVRAAGREYLFTGDKNKALLAARDMASRNPIGSFVIPLEASDLEFGIGNRVDSSSPYTFVNTGSGNAVRLTTSSFANGDVGVSPIFPFLNIGSKIQPELTAVSTQGAIDIALVIDRSGSMAYSSSEIAEYPPIPSNAPAGWDFGDPVPPQARWLDLVAAVEVFVGELDASPSQEMVALTIYDDTSTTLLSLRNEYSQIVSELNFISEGYENGGSNIGGGMLGGRAALNNTTFGREDASKVIIVMTDGVHNFGTSPAKAANRVSNSGITMFTVTFSDEAGQASMEAAAQQCGGRNYHAANATQLKDAFQQIVRSLPTLLTE